LIVKTTTIKLKIGRNESESIISERKSISRYNFYINICCKNNKFELLLQSLFDIINPITDICFAIFADGVIYSVLFAFGAVDLMEYDFQ